MKILEEIFFVYVITFIVVSSDLMHHFRRWFKYSTPHLRVNGSHPIECRMCSGFWIAASLCFFSGSSVMEFFLVYGASYFLATQER